MSLLNELSPSRYTLVNLCKVLTQGFIECADHIGLCCDETGKLVLGLDIGYRLYNMAKLVFNGVEESLIMLSISGRLHKEVQSDLVRGLLVEIDSLIGFGRHLLFL